MENASKALLIAGAILIAILLIGIGMAVFGNIGGITDSADQQMSAMEIQAFNKQFEQYKGENVPGSKVKALISAINTSNATYANDDSKQIKVSEKGNTNLAESGTKPVTLSATIGANYRYKVDFSTDPSGFINGLKLNQIK